jgi:hypothetical protein
VLNGHGWHPCGPLAAQTSIIGIDRHGQAALQPVHFSRQDETREVFVGTHAACGRFSEDTYLLDNQGQRILVGSLIESGEVAEHSFEAFTFQKNFVFGPDAWARIYEILARSAAKSGENTIAMLRQDDGEPTKDQPFGLRAVKLGSRWFCLIDRQAGGVTNKNWAQALFELCDFTMRNREGEIEIDMAIGDFALWLMSASQKRDQKFHLAFDSIQHTASIRFVEQPSSRLVPRGQCSFRFAKPSEAVQMSWQIAGWSPIINGFLVASA